MNFVNRISPNPMWDTSHLKMTNSYGDVRVSVDAGPGTGKTVVACARQDYLINEEDTEPSNIRVISFTRAAVAEICDRPSHLKHRCLCAASIR